MINYSKDQPRRSKRKSLVNKKMFSERRHYARSQIPQRKSNIQNVLTKVQNNQILTQDEKRKLSTFVGKQIPIQKPPIMYQTQNHDKEIFYYQIIDFFSLQDHDSPNWVLEYIKKMFLQQQAQVQNLKQNLKIQKEDMYKIKASFKSEKNKLQIQINRLQKKNQNSLLINQDRDQKINQKWEKILENQIQQNHKTTLQMQIVIAENKHTTLLYDYLFKNVISYLESKGLWNQNFNMSNFQYTIQTLNDLEMYSNLSTSQINEDLIDNPERNKIEKVNQQLRENQQNYQDMQSEIKIGRIKLKNLEIKLNSSADQNQTQYLEVLELRNQLKEKIIILENNQKIIEEQIEQDKKFLEQKQEDSKYQFKEIELNLQQFYLQHIQQIQSRQKQIFKFLESNKMDFKNDNYLQFLKKASKQLQVEKSLSIIRQLTNTKQNQSSIYSNISQQYESQTNDQLSLMTQVNQLKMENCQLQQQIQQQNQDTTHSNLTSQFLKVNYNHQDGRITSRSRNGNFHIKNIFSWLLSEKEEDDEDDLKSFSMYQQPIDQGFKLQNSKRSLIKKQHQIKVQQQNYIQTQQLKFFKKKKSQNKIIKLTNLYKKMDNLKIKNLLRLQSKIQQIYDTIVIMKNLIVQKNDYIKKQSVLMNDQFKKNNLQKKEISKLNHVLNLLQVKDINDHQNLQRIENVIKVGDFVLKKTIKHDILEEVQEVFEFYKLKQHKIFENCINISNYEDKLNEFFNDYSTQQDKKQLSKANTNEELNSIWEKHLDIKIQSYQDVNSIQNVFDKNDENAEEQFNHLNKEYNKISKENDRLTNKFLEFQEEILNLNQKVQEQQDEIENLQKDKISDKKNQNQKKINELRKNLKNVRKKLETRNFIISAFKLKQDEDNLKEKVQNILKQLDPNSTFIDFNVFNSNKKQQIFQSIKEELSDINFDYFSKVDQSSQESFNESYNQTQYKRKKKNKIQDLDKAKSENNKVVLKSRFITTFAPKRNKTKQKKQKDFESMFEDAFKDL